MAPQQQEQEPKTKEPSSATENGGDEEEQDHEENYTAQDSMTPQAERKSIDDHLLDQASNSTQTDPLQSEEKKEQIDTAESERGPIPSRKDDEIVASGTESSNLEKVSVSKPRQNPNATRSCQNDDQLDRRPPSESENLTRGADVVQNPTTEAVAPTQSGDAGAPIPSLVGADSQSTIHQNVSPQLPQNKENQHHISKKGVCHPSKLIRDNSASTLQPHHSIPEVEESIDTMPPNSRPLRPPPRVDEGREDLISADSSFVADKDVTAWESLTTRETLLAAQDEMDYLDTSIASRPESIVQDEIDQLDTSISSRPEPMGRGPVPENSIEIPPSPSHKRATLQYQEESQEPEIVMAPPGTVVIRHANGEHAFASFQPGPYGYPMQYPVMQHGVHSMQPVSSQIIPSAPSSVNGSSGRRKITLRLEEDVKDSSRKSFFFRRRTPSMGDGIQSLLDHADRGTVSVSWFEGTSSIELQEHVRRSVIRKLNLQASTELVDLRIIDQSVEPNEEIVLSPFIPDGATFLLRFSTRPIEKPSALSRLSSDQRFVDFSAPESPSAAQSPYPSNADLENLNAQLLKGKLSELKPPSMTSRRKSALKQKSSFPPDQNVDQNADETSSVATLKKVDETDTESKASELHPDDVMDYSPEDQIEARLRQLADLLISDRKTRKSSRRQKEKRQVVFVIANYFVLFLSLIALSAELSARAPKWLQWVESQLESVQKCSTDQDALFECVSKGDFAGLVASVILWLSRSAATHQFFLFGFDTPKKLWTAVYESLVTAFCWGTSYMVIRRGMNPDTRAGFVRKYWKDAVYGSLAGFNAAFMKQVLKNLIPQEAFEDALLKERQLKILSWLPSFH